MRKRITLEQTDQEIINAYKSGKSLQIIADFNGTTSKTISRLLRKNGVEIRKRHEHRCKPLEKILADQKSGMTIDSIMSKYGFSSKNAWYAWKHYHKDAGFKRKGI